MLLCPDTCDVNHHVFVIVIFGQMTKDPFDDTAFTEEQLAYLSKLGNQLKAFSRTVSF